MKTKRNFSKWVILAVVLILVIAYFFPMPLMPKTSDISSIYYRPEGSERLYLYYSNGALFDGSQNVDIGELSDLLNHSKAIRDVSSIAIDGVPIGGVSLWITVSENDGEKYRDILLGELNEVRVSGSSVRRIILSPDSVLDKALDILGIDENTDLSMMTSIN